MEPLDIIEKYNSYGMITPEDKIELGDFCPDEESFDALKSFLDRTKNLSQERPSAHVKTNLDDLFIHQYGAQKHTPNYRKLSLYTSIGIAASLGFILTLRSLNFESVAPKEMASIEKPTRKETSPKRLENPAVTASKLEEFSTQEIVEGRMDGVEASSNVSEDILATDYAPPLPYEPEVVRESGKVAQDEFLYSERDSDKITDVKTVEMVAIATKSSRTNNKNLSEVIIDKKKEDKPQAKIETEVMLNTIFALY